MGEQKFLFIFFWAAVAFFFIAGLAATCGH